MVDSLTVKGGVAVAKLSLGRALALWKDHANRNTDALREAVAADGRKWRVERDHLVERRLAELESAAGQQQQATADAVVATVERLLGDQQFFRLERNYEFEAAREATDERRRMLAFASAWSVSPELSIAQLARVERTIRELDPDDVSLLKHLADLPPPPPIVIPEDQRGDPQHEREYRQRDTAALMKHRNTLFMHWREANPRGEVLPAAGCVLITPGVPVAGGTSTNLRVTDLGLNVLRVLQGYAPGTAADGAPKDPAQ